MLSFYEEMASECLTLARKTGKEGYEEVAAELLRLRNEAARGGWWLPVPSV